MKTDINQVIFSRMRPERKKEIIESLDRTELLSLKQDTIKRIIKEVGNRMYQSRNKELRLLDTFRTGNKWDSTIESWCIMKGKIYIDFYVQYENTDTNISDTFDNFIRRGEYLGQIHRDDRYGNPRTYYFTYNEADKSRALRALLNNYVAVKYHDKLEKSKEIQV